MLMIARGQTFVDLSLVTNGFVPTVWQIELIDQVVWCSTQTRTRLPQKYAVSAPIHDIDHRPPMTAGSRSEAVTSHGNSRLIRAMSLSASRSGANRFWSVCSTSNS